MLPSGVFTPSLVRSVQYGTVTVPNLSLTATATITAVATGRALLLYLGCSSTFAQTKSQVRLELTDATTVTAIRGDVSISTIVSFCVLEFHPQVIKSVQRGTVSLTAGNLSNTAAITSVNTAKSVLSWIGQSSDTGDATDNFARLDLTSATVVTATRAVSTNNMIAAFQVVEWR